MKGNPAVIKTLNSLLTSELSAINQYMVHSEMLTLWGYDTLAKAVRERARDEMKHAESLIERVLLLDGQPNVGVLAPPVRVGVNVQSILESDTAAEVTAVGAYRNAGVEAVASKDEVTFTLVASILADEEDHLVYLEAQGVQISQMGFENYLSTIK